ncbi:MAG TPA: hypothetical protein VF664_19625, partial [Cystobacter sp.]
MSRQWGVPVLLAGMVAVSGCEGEKPVPPPPIDLQGEGDWTDTGRYATCNVYSVPGKACGDAEAFNVSSCDVASLAQVPADGIYTLVYRTDSQVPGIGADAFRVSADGRLDSFHGAPPTERRIGPREFFLTSTRALSPAVTVRNTLVGCRAEGTRLYGCYVNCRNGRYNGFGTFLAERWTRRAGEGEASGLRLTSESFVEQGLPVDVYVTQGHAYVVSVPNGPEKGGLSVFDVSNPAAPVLRSTLGLPTDNYWNGVWAKGNTLYVASADSGVIVFDLSEPASPKLVRQVPSGQGALDVHT